MVRITTTEALTGGIINRIFHARVVTDSVETDSVERAAITRNGCFVKLPAVLRSIRKRWLAVVALAFLGVVLAAIVTSRIPAQYASRVTFFVSTPVSSTSQLFNASQFGADRVNSYVKLVGSDELARRIVKAQHLGDDPHHVASQLSATADLNTVLLTATATGPTPSMAESLARGIQTQLGPLVQELDVTPASKTPAVELSVVTGPTEAVQTDPKRKLNLSVGLLLGLLAGLAWALLREMTDTSVKAVDQLGDVSGQPVLGTASLASRGSNPLMPRDDGYNPLAEEIRQIRTNLQFVNVDRPPKVIAVSSAVSGDGKTTMSIDLAAAFSEGGQQVLLVDADLRRGQVARYLDLDGTVGLSDILANRVELDDVIIEKQPHLWVIPSGTVPPNPVELLDSRHMSTLLNEMSERFDIVIVDTPPVLPVTDGAVVASKSDGVILVARHGVTKRAQVEEATAAVNAVRAQCLGWILNQVPRTRRDRSYYSYQSAASPSTMGSSVKTDDSLAEASKTGSRKK